MNILGIVQEFCKRTGLSVPTLAATSQDDTIIQIVALCNEVVEDILDRGSWTSFQREAVFTSVAAASQGALTTLADSGYQSIISETLFDRTQSLRILGPLSPQEWQGLQSIINTQPLTSFRVQEGNLQLYPIPPAGRTIAFEYTSNTAIYNAADAEYKTEFTKDTDVFSLPYQLLLKGLRWRWKEEKGFPYAESFRQYERSIVLLKSKDGAPGPIYMDGDTQHFAGPGIFVPDSRSA
jgi:hypothetical protein